MTLTLTTTHRFGIATAVLALSGCTAAGGGEAIDTEVSDDNSAPIIANTTNRWQNPGNIPVCFVNGDGTSKDEKFVRDLVVSEYAKAGLCFTGWSRCSSNPPCPTIRLYMGIPSGRDPKWAGESYVGAVCRVTTPWTVWLRPDQLNHAAVHEFGHAIGLHHEHARTDNQKECSYSSSEIVPEGNGNHYYTVYDPNSVMSYCGQDRLTATDIAGIRSFYGTSGAVQCGGSTGSTGGGTTTTCTYPCSQYGFKSGQCLNQNGVNWQCDGSCIQKVSSCSTSSTSSSANSCQYSCAQYGFTYAECGKDQNGNSWQCDGSCLRKVNSCTYASSCQYTCSDYGYSPGQCYRDPKSGASWKCNGACLVQVNSCQ